MFSHPDAVYNCRLVQKNRKETAQCTKQYKKPRIHKIENKYAPENGTCPEVQ